MTYKSTSFKQKIIINKIVTIHYFEYMNDFVFNGEAHNFWEFLCVDKGEVEVEADNRLYHLKQGDIIFHKPMEFHTVKANGITAPNLVVISFETSSKSMDFFKEKIFALNDDEWNLISKIIIEAQNAYQSAITIPSVEKVTRSISPAFGAEQLIKLYLEQLFITLVRKNTPNKVKKSLTYMHSKNEGTLLQKIVLYLENNICTKLTVDDICHENLISRSHLQQLFHKHYDCGVIEYFNSLKINTAKQMIRMQNMNFTEIANYLGYSSIHSFSNQFKHITGMSPSEYLHSIKHILKPFN